MRDTFVQIFKDNKPESNFSEETVQGENVMLFCVDANKCSKDTC